MSSKSRPYKVQSALQLVVNSRPFLRDKIEVILQETLFEPRSLLEATVADTMSMTLEIRDAILNRTKAIRTGSEDITICPGQGVNQVILIVDLLNNFTK